MKYTIQQQLELWGRQAYERGGDELVPRNTEEFTMEEDEERNALTPFQVFIPEEFLVDNRSKTVCGLGARFFLPSTLEEAESFWEGVEPEDIPRYAHQELDSGNTGFYLVAEVLVTICAIAFLRGDYPDA
jgi:hypothetical protein